MKVIKKGKPIISQQEVTCPKCEAVLQIIPQDLRSIPSGVFYYTCPCCNREHSLSKEELNEDMLFEIEKLLPWKND